MYIIAHQIQDTYLQPDGTFDESLHTADHMNIEKAELTKIELAIKRVPVYIHPVEDLGMLPLNK